MTRIRQPRGRTSRSLAPAFSPALLALLAALVPCSPASAQPPGTPGPLGTHALTGARLVVAPGEVIAPGTVVIRDGVIEAVGANVAPPADARVWELEGLTVYPGLVEAYAVRRWPGEDEESDESASGGAGTDPGAGDPSPVVRAEREIAAWGIEARAARQLRDAGYGVAAVAPGGGLLRGWSAVVALGDGPVRENLLVPHLAQAVSLSARGQGGYPESLMGAIALTRETFLEARWYQDVWRTYAEHPAQRRPHRNAALAALGPAVDRVAPVVFESEDLLDVFRAGRLADELALDAWIVASGEEYRRAAEVAALDAPLLVPLDFPDAPSAPDDPLSLELDALRHWKSAPGNPAALVDAGADLVVTTFRLGAPKEIHGRMAKAIEAGLSPDEALAAVTTGPARLLGLDDRLGTIAAGKIANLVVAEGDLFTEETKLREVWVDGRRYELEERKPPEVEPAGEWDLSIDAGGQTFAGRLLLEGEAPNLTGRLTVQGVQVELSSAEVSGSTVEIEFDGSAFGMPGAFEMSLDVEGDRARGGGSGPPGAFTVEGTRVSGPADAGPPEEVRR